MGEATSKSPTITEWVDQMKLSKKERLLLLFIIIFFIVGATLNLLSVHGVSNKSFITPAIVALALLFGARFYKKK